MPEIIYPELSYQVQGALYDVYNALRYQDLSENGWEKALMIALAGRNVPAQQQAEFELRYKGYRIGRFFTDIVADEKLILELKVRDRLLPIDVAQVLNYLKVTGLRLGILVNFGKNGIEIQRIPNFLDQRPAERPQTQVLAPTGDLLYEELSGAVRAILYEVHGEIGPGFMHMHYPSSHSNRTASTRYPLRGEKRDRRPFSGTTDRDPRDTSADCRREGTACADSCSGSHTHAQGSISPVSSTAGPQARLDRQFSHAQSGDHNSQTMREE